MYIVFMGKICSKSSWDGYYFRYLVFFLNKNNSDSTALCFIDVKYSDKSIRRTKIAGVVIFWKEGKAGKQKPGSNHESATT